MISETVSESVIPLKVHRYDLIEFIERYNTNQEKPELYTVLEHLPPIVKDKMWLAGGAVRRTLQGEKLESDLDFFFKDEETLKNYKKELEEKGAKQTNVTETNEMYTIRIKDNDYFIQLIYFQYYPTVNHLLDSFDYTITQFATDGENLYCGEYALWDLARKRLVLHRLTYGVATLRRLLKYTKQGFKACTGTFTSILSEVVNNPRLINEDVEYID